MYLTLNYLLTRLTPFTQPALQATGWQTEEPQQENYAIFYTVGIQGIKRDNCQPENKVFITATPLAFGTKSAPFFYEFCLLTHALQKT
jgi:hypothetical protein